MSPSSIIFSALIKAQSQFKPIPKNGYNPHFKSHYATLSDCWEGVQEALHKNGLSVIQRPITVDGDLQIETIIFHDSGESISGFYPVVATQNNPQAIGSSVSYARRYSLKAMLNITDEEGEDDGNAASAKPPQKPAPKPVQKSAPKSDQKELVGEKSLNELFALAKKKGVEIEVTKETSVEKAREVWKALNALPNKAMPNPPLQRKLISEAQLKRLWAIGHEMKWDDAHIHDYIGKEFGLESTKELDTQQYNLLIAEMSK